MKEKLRELGYIVLGIGILAGSILLGAAFIYGAVLVSVKAMPWLYGAFFLAFGFALFVSLPLSFLRRTRPFAAGSWIIVSYVFGLNLWCFALLLTLILWGALAVIIGLVVAGVGIVPVALLATVFKGEWEHFFNLVFLLALTFGCRGLGAYLLYKVEEAARREYRPIPENIDFRLRPTSTQPSATSKESMESIEQQHNAISKGGFMDKPFLEPFTDHLDFLGYEVERKEGWSKALHERRMNIFFKEYNGGILLTGSYTSDDFAKGNRGDYLNFINMLNRRALVARIYADDEGSICFDAWFSGIYDKKQFGMFMDSWHYDKGELLSKSEPETTKYLR